MEPSPMNPSRIPSSVSPVAQRVLDGQLRSTCEPEQAPVTGVREPAAILPPQVQHESTAAVPKPGHLRWPLPTQPPALMTLNDRAASSLQAGDLQLRTRHGLLGSQPKLERRAAWRLPQRTWCSGDI